MPIVAAVVGLVAAVYLFGWQWTGFYVHHQPEVAGTWKTLWDWLDLLIIPAVLGIAALFFNKAENRRSDSQAEARATLERESARERWEEAILDDYLGRMSGLLLNDGLRTRFTETETPLQGEAASHDINTRGVARAFTMMALSRLKSVERKNVVTRFLWRVGLLQGDASLLSGAELEGIHLREVELLGANLSNAVLSKADLRGAALVSARLSGADLSEADLRHALLIRAKLHKAKLQKANLANAQLQSADLTGANLSGADLTNTNLSEADLRDADLSDAILTNANIKDAKNVDRAKGRPRS